MPLKLLLVPLPLNRRITPRLRKVHLHRLPKQLEILDLLDRLLRARHIAEHHKRLPLRLQVGLGHDVDDLAVFTQELGERLLEGVDLDGLFEVLDVDTRDKLGRYVGVCAMPRTSRLGGLGPPSCAVGYLGFFVDC